MIVVVDGTGPDSDAAYRQELGASFCSQIAQMTGGEYFRGPTLWGSEVEKISQRAADAAMALVGAGKPALLAGYSRGGCAVILAAKILKERGVRVQAMFLFDAVDMQVSDMSSSQVIGDNVDYVAHATSARDLLFWIQNPIKSRFYFYNTGRWLSGSGVMAERSFTGSHGAIGGAPWSDVSGDADCAHSVAKWMNNHLSIHGVSASLKLKS